MGTTEVVLKATEVDARLKELFVQHEQVKEAWHQIAGAIRELEFVKRRFAEAVEAPPVTAGEPNTWQLSLDSPPGSCTSEAGAEPSLAEQLP
jgi:hypothetical protein